MASGNALGNDFGKLFLIGIDAAALTVPMTFGGAVIVYCLIAPEFLSSGVLASCFGMALDYVLTACIHRPVVYAVRFLRRQRWPAW